MVVNDSYHYYTWDIMLLFIINQKPSINGRVVTVALTDDWSLPSTTGVRLHPQSGVRPTRRRNGKDGTWGGSSCRDSWTWLERQSEKLQPYHVLSFGLSSRMVCFFFRPTILSKQKHTFILNYCSPTSLIGGFNPSELSSFGIIIPNGVDFV